VTNKDAMGSGGGGGEEAHVLNPGAHLDVVRNDPENYVIVAVHTGV